MGIWFTDRIIYAQDQLSYLLQSNKFFSIKIIVVIAWNCFRVFRNM